MKLIVITGCTRGLGRALVDEFLARGHTVVGCGRNAEGIMDLRFAHAAPHAFDVIDVTQATKVALWSERILASCGVPDLLINNAALMNTPAALWKVPAEEFGRLIDVNITGVANVIRGFVPAMVERRTGIVVNLSSGWGRSVSAEVAPYCASKWAIEGLTKALAEELPEGMAAVALNPGVIDTDMLRKCWGGGAASYPSAVVWARVAAPFILELDAKANGRSVNVPGVPVD